MSSSKWIWLGFALEYTEPFSPALSIYQSRDKVYILLTQVQLSFKVLLAGRQYPYSYLTWLSNAKVGSHTTPVSPLSWSFVLKSPVESHGRLMPASSRVFMPLLLVALLGHWLKIEVTVLEFDSLVWVLNPKDIFWCSLLFSKVSNDFL